jgi:hypothetical protein
VGLERFPGAMQSELLLDQVPGIVNELNIIYWMVENTYQNWSLVKVNTQSEFHSPTLSRTPQVTSSSKKPKQAHFSQSLQNRGCNTSECCGSLAKLRREQFKTYTTLPWQISWFLPQPCIHQCADTQAQIPVPVRAKK